jgi:hypothetical protein
MKNYNFDTTIKLGLKKLIKRPWPLDACLYDRSSFTDYSGSGYKQT